MKPLENIKSYWVLIAFITSLVLWYGSVNHRLNQVEAKYDELKVVIQSVNKLTTDIAVIKNDVSYIKERVK